ncbi:hypothetical protein ACWGXJ_08230 [Paenibacillus sp. S33]
MEVQPQSGIGKSLRNCGRWREGKLRFLWEKQELLDSYSGKGAMFKARRERIDFENLSGNIIIEILVCSKKQQMELFITVKMTLMYQQRLNQGGIYVI